MNIRELRENIEGIAIGYDYEAVYGELYNTMDEYWCETQHWFGEDLFANFVDYDYAEELAKYELEEGGLARLYYFMGDVNFVCCNLLKINAYGNLEEVDIDDLNLLKDELIAEIDEEIECLGYGEEEEDE